MFILALDGPAGAGKSVVAARVARRLGWPLIDTGAIYRTVTLVAMRARLDLADESSVGTLARQLRVTIGQPVGTDLEYSVVCDGEDVTTQLFTEDIDRRVSVVAAHPTVREAVLPLQRNAASGDSVVVGRDIGTVVFPDAKLKIYLDASPEIRAERRRRQMLDRGVELSYEQVLEDVRRRDGVDSNRATAPLRVAEDAVVLDTDPLGIDEVVDRLVALVAERTSAIGAECHSPARHG